MNTAPCGFVAFADDGTIAEINETLAGMLGYTRVELLGWHVDKILPPGGRIFYHTYLFPLLKVRQSVEEIYIALRMKSGEDVPVLLNGVRRERDGRFLSDCVCLRMIQRHEYEDQLLQARRLAEESNAAKAKFLSMMSHDLRTPLTTIYANAQLLAMEALTAEQLDAVREIRQACELQMTMISDILEFARLDSGQVEVQTSAIPVADAVTRAEALVRVQVSEAGLQLTTNDCDADMAVMADPRRLQQILLNLLTNAIKFTPPGGEVAVQCETEGERVRIRVRDTGIGIPSDQLQRIFSPFVQLGPSAPSRGVGLGLAISRDLARAMSGDVTAESTPGAGSVFTVELPACHPEQRRL
ncbi:MAG TPA: PAS domain-containing sensor histidine kinase [Thermoanaerobaculia bacterium]|nr:PAS domain-containing sensor histidine kinase [Thermoanaerobaculia bacterium]